MKEYKFDFDDILIEPSSLSNINSRKDVNFYDENGMLPLFTAPMDTVVDINNVQFFEKNLIYPILPRTVESEVFKSYIYTTHDKYWTAVGLKEFEDIFLDSEFSFDKKYILIDIANGHMSRLLDDVKMAKNKYGDRLILMVGNIANPETFYNLSKVGADYCRVGIGNGGGCFIKGTEILTENGYKKIENVTTDDSVLTHTGEWKPVILTHNLFYEENLIDINGTVSTKDHEYYVIDKDKKDIITDDNYIKYGYWIKAEDLDEKKHLLMEMEKNEI